MTPQETLRERTGGMLMLTLKEEGAGVTEVNCERKSIQSTLQKQNGDGALLINWV